MRNRLGGLVDEVGVRDFGCGRSVFGYAAALSRARDVGPFAECVRMCKVCLAILTYFSPDVGFVCQPTGGPALRALKALMTPLMFRPNMEEYQFEFGRV